MLGHHFKCPQYGCCTVDNATFPAEHIRPGRTLLAWGCGDAGELGLHPKPNDEVEFPRASAWMKQAIEGGKFGEPGAGLEDVEAGGMHSLAVDEEGRVS